MFSSGHRLVAAIVGLGIGVWAVVPPARAEAWRLTGRGGDAEWGETPVVVELKAPIPAGSYVLEAGGTGGPITAAAFRDGDRAFLATVLPRVAARQFFSYAMRAQPAP